MQMNLKREKVFDMQEEVILKVEKLNKTFGGLKATDNVNYEMINGELSAIIGPNGAGKSTFFNLLTGYHKLIRERYTIKARILRIGPPIR